METRAPLTPELYVVDLDASLAFYLEVLGFELEFARREEGFAAVCFGPSRLMLEQAPSLEPSTPDETRNGQWRPARLERPFGRGINFEFEVPHVDVIHERFRSRGLSLLVELHEKTYIVGAEAVRVRQFVAADPDGYLVRPSQTLSIVPR